MARGVNKVILIGNLGKDPEVQSFDNYKKAAFSLATTEHSRDKDGNDVQHTEWHNIVVWRGLAEVAELYLRKGSQVFIEGKLRTRSFDGKDGVKKYVTEIQADNMVLLGARREGGNETYNQQTGQSANGQPSGQSSYSPSALQNSYSHPANPVIPPLTEPSPPAEEKDDLPF